MSAPLGGTAPSGTVPPGTVPTGANGRRLGRRELGFGMGMLLPAVVILGVIVVYPVLATISRSFFGREGDEFVGIDNYRTLFDRDSTREAIANNIVWVVVAPALVTTVGLVLAVLTQRLRFSTALKIVIFMPMAISSLAAGVIFRFVYEQDPDRGLANAVATSVTGLWDSDGPYTGARPAQGTALDPAGGGFLTTTPVRVAGGAEAGVTVLLGMVGLRPADVPGDAAAAAEPAARTGAISGVVWLDAGVSGGERGRIDPGERGLPGMAVAAVDANGRTVARTTSADDGTFSFDGLPPGDYRMQLSSSNFDTAWRGWQWLGTTDVTPIGPAVVTISVILAYLWIWAGFAMVVVSAGLAAIPNEVQEAARVDGAGEWQVFRRVTVPLLWPVLLVVLVTLVINVLKIFDLVLVIPPGSSQADANVIALELWRVSFGGARDQGLGSALGVLLFVLVVPFMAWNIRRFRLEHR